MDITPASMVGQISPVGLAVAAVIAVIEYGLLLYLVRRTLNSPGIVGAARSRPVLGGVVAAFVAGATVFPFSIASVQVPLQAAAGQWASATLATANLYILSIPAVALSGLVQEPAKLLAAFLGLLLAGAFRPGTRPAEAVHRAVLFGAVAGLAFGGIEAAWALSPVFAALGSPGVTAGTVAVAVIERFFAVLFHLTTATFMVYAWSRSAGKGVLTLGAMILLHGLANYVVVPAGLGHIGTWTAELWIGALALVAFWLLVRLCRRAGAGPPEALQDG